MDKRVYLQYQPTDASLEMLNTVQRQLSQEYPEAVALPIAKLHLTLLHIGIIDEVWQELLRAGATISRSAFENTLDKYLEEAQAYLPPHTDTPLLSYGLFGPNEDVFTICLQADDKLRAAQQQALGDWSMLLTRIGVYRVDQFLAVSPNFRFALEFNPHISLFRHFTHPLPKASKLQDVLHFDLLPPRYDLKHGRYTQYPAQPR